MRTRVLAVLMTLMTGLITALGVPLALSYAAAQARAVYIDRLADAERFADLLPLIPNAVDETAVLDEIRRYEDLFGIPVTVLGADGSVSIASRPGALGDDPRRLPAVRAALSGRTSPPPDLVLPSGQAPLVVAQPVVRNGDVVGAVVTVSDQHAARERVARIWLSLVGLGCLVLALAFVIVQVIASWILRPVAVLDDAAHELADGDLGVRVPVAGGPLELRRLGESFNRMAGSVEASLRAQRAFVADASHQLRNPLSALLMRLQAMTLATAPGPAADAAERALDDGRHLAETLDRMLELARTEHLAPAAGPVDLDDLLDRRVASWRVVAEHREVVIRRAGASGTSAWHHPAAIAGALDAVLDNALKYGPEGGSIDVTVLPGEAFVEIVVADEGPGLPADELDRAADRFWRSPRHPELPGSGLGLTIASTLLARHGGELVTATAPGRGLTVRIRLPTGPGAQGLADR